MNGVLERTLGILELLARHGDGQELAAIADQIGMPRSAAHRLLGDLIRCEYVRQTRDKGEYILTTKLVSMGLTYLSETGIIDIAQPLLDRLAESTGELVRLSVIDGKRLTWVARAQGARQGLRYDPDMGEDARLSCSASGLAWMSTMGDDEALALAAQQGLGMPPAYGPNAPSSMQAMLEMVHAANERGFAVTQETFTPGLNAIAAPVRLEGQAPMGVISIAGPTVRFTEARMQALGPALVSSAAQLAAASGASAFFNQHLRKPASRNGLKPIYAD
ncbi:IclR family transcriptional regulator [Cupriavidus basilensis]|uniref:IclR family transcriptional regulator n=1 Tax=Cupriavidus basilensis TaxID=68895 RepID=A0ABT6B1P8_9BURK|nr:IclR family transcriptional regulator [Cupriavidus basilensis]MDF3838819.1 IclR family transcriptional regulator [Cupriavidus basilensis]